MASSRLCQLLRRANVVRFKWNSKYSQLSKFQYPAILHKNTRPFHTSKSDLSIVSAQRASDWHCELREKALTITSANEILTFHYVWLRDHCRCPLCFNAVTNQRQLDTHTIDLSIKPKHVSFTTDSLQVTWPDDHVSLYAFDWLSNSQYGQPYSSFLVKGSERIFWGSSLAEQLPEMESFESVLENEPSLLKVCDNISKYGFALVKDTPTTEAAMGDLGDALGGVKDSMFGKTWEVTVVSDSSEELDHADMAYMNVALHGHTDGTYFLDQPRLQLFHCHQHTGTGGQTLLVDAIGAAEKLKRVNREAFDFLANTHIPAKYLEPGQNFRCLGPMIKVDPYSNEVYHVRINGDDRDVLSCLRFDEVELFYTHLHAYTSILRDKSSELWFKLTPGTALIVNNWRVLHGRAAFTGTRSLGGCYVGHDEHTSKHRVLINKHRGEDV